MNKIVIVTDKETGEYIPFTIGSRGEIVITDLKQYNLDNLIVSFADPILTKELDNRFYVFYSGRRND